MKCVRLASEYFAAAYPKCFNIFTLLIVAVLASSVAHTVFATPVSPPAHVNTVGASEWAYSYIRTAGFAGILPAHLQTDYAAAITRAEFTAFAVALYETVTGRVIQGRVGFSDSTDENVEKMAYLGVVLGVGYGEFMPHAPIRREEAAVILSRLAVQIGLPLAFAPPAFLDNHIASEWAQVAIGQMQATGIMGGVGDGMFDPLGQYTREQSVITMVRMHNLMSNRHQAGFMQMPLPPMPQPVLTEHPGETAPHTPPPMQASEDVPLTPTGPIGALPNRRLTESERAVWIAEYNAAGGASQFEREVIRLVNAERAAHGLQAVEMDVVLMLAARFYAQTLANHNLPMGLNEGPYGGLSNTVTAFGNPRAGWRHVTAGAQTAQALLDEWKSSETQRANILRANVTRVGFGTFQGGDLGVFHIIVLDTGYVQTEFVSQIAASPTNPDFGSPPVGYTQRNAQTIRITNTGNQPVTMNPLPTVQNWTLTPGMNWNEPMNPGQARSFNLRPNTGLPIGAYNTSFNVTASDGLSQQINPSFSVGFGQTAISVTPTSVDFGTHPAGYARRPQRTIIVRNTGELPVTLSPLAPVPGWTITPGSTWTGPMQPNQQRAFTIRPDDGLAGGVHNHTITVTGSGGASASVAFLFTVEGGVQASIAASHTTINFQGLPEGYTEVAPQIITITNTGAIPITLAPLPYVANWTLVPAENWAYPMQPAQTRTFTIRPNTGLGQGTYNTTFAVSGSENTSLNLTANFAVGLAEPTVTGVVIHAPASIQAGQSHTLTATVHGTNNHPTEVVWSLTQSGVGVAIDALSGVLTVSEHAESQIITVRATSVHPSGIYATVQVQILAIQVLPPDVPESPDEPDLPEDPDLPHAPEEPENPDDD